MHVRPYEKLIVWKEAYQLCLSVYKVTRSFPKDEQYSLTSQIRRSASSVPLNIAEGNTRRSSKEKIRFFEIAEASLEELHCQLQLACDLGYLEQKVFLNLDEQIRKTSFLLMSLKKSLSPIL